METIKTTALLRMARILSLGDLRRLAVTQTSVKANADVKNSQGVNNNDNNNNLP